MALTTVRPVRPVALSIAGSDSGGGAGVAADVKTFEAHGVWAAIAVTAVTAQDTTGVYAVHAVPPDVVCAQIDRVAGDFRVAATKTGMLAGAAIVEAVAAMVRAGDGRLGPLVVDPVLAASHGQSLLDAGAAIIAGLLVPLAAVVTPNLAEAGALLGGGATIDDRRGMESAARELVAAGARAALVTGGHLAGAAAADCLFIAGQRDVIWLEAAMLDQAHTHGSGCALSAAIAARLARGEDIEASCRGAKTWVTGAIAAGFALGRGVGPVDPGWEARPV